jgi:hypothetical protein
MQFIHKSYRRLKSFIMTNKKYSLFFLIFFCITNVFSQIQNQQKTPVFPACQNATNQNAESCFYNQLQDFIYQNFNTSAVPDQKDFTGKVITLFEVDTTGTFKVLYIDAISSQLIDETKRVFQLLPKIAPATFNGKPTYAKYTINIAFPLQSAAQIAQEKEREDQLKKANNPNLENPEFDQVELNYKTFQNPQYNSNLNIPFSHSLYSQFDDKMNQVGTNNHTASKPYTYNEVVKYYNLEEENNKLKLGKTGWWGRKIFDQNLVQIQGQNYWFTMNPVFDLRLGKTNSNTLNYTFTNTRALQIQGGLGKQLNFTTIIYESQAVFADYYNRYSESLKPSGGNPAVIPGIGIAKDFNITKYDIPSADANITYTPSQFINMQLGYSRNFLGDGYRSLLQGDGTSPYPFFKINTSFWKIKYTNNYMVLKDVRPEVTFERTYATKYMANHYLSWNASKRLNIGFFESVVWANDNGRGFDPNFLNPIIFYRSVEFSSSGRSGNAVLGFSSKYKWNNKINLYGQFLIDEFSVGDISAGKGSWKNKLGYQLGIKYYNAFGINNLYLQAEYNQVRPYTYSHSNPITNYAHINQSLGHNWGANFREFIGIARFNKKRIFAETKFTYGIRGFDFENSGANSNYGTNIYRDYDDERFADNGVLTAQGNKTIVFFADLQAGYLVNTSTNLKIFGNLIYRNFAPSIDTPTVFKENTTWFSIGLRSDVFNWYFDY